MDRLRRIEVIDAARGVQVAWVRKGVYLVCLAGVSHALRVPASGRADVVRRVRAALAAHDASANVASLRAIGALAAGEICTLTLWNALNSGC